MIPVVDARSATFADNLLDQQEDPLSVVHPYFDGYIVEPATAFQTAEDQILLPYPLNRDTAEKRYYTYRDTALDARGGTPGVTSPNLFWETVTQYDGPSYNGGEQIQSCQLPLLMEFRTYPTNQGLGLNQFDVGLTYFGASGPVPGFRAHTSGGSGEGQDIDPDLTDVALGGFNPFSNPPGGTTPPVDQLCYFGAVDFVVRVSRASSVWYTVEDPDGASIQQAVIEPAVVVPPAEEQPPGTAVQIDYRAATVLASTEPEEDALSLDAYGDFYTNGSFPKDAPNNGISFLENQSEWQSDPTLLVGAQYYQLRATFISNADSGEIPELASIGVAWGR